MQNCVLLQALLSAVWIITITLLISSENYSYSGRNVITLHAPRPPFVLAYVQYGNVLAFDGQKKKIINAYGCKLHTIRGMYVIINRYYNLHYTLCTVFARKRRREVTSDVISHPGGLCPTRSSAAFFTVVSKNKTIYNVRIENSRNNNNRFRFRHGRKSKPLEFQNKDLRSS